MSNQSDGGLFKTCPDCGELKPTTDFGLNRTRPDGLAHYCKACFRIRASAQYRKKRAELGFEVRERVDLPGRRRCAGCGEIKVVADFHKAASKRSGLNCYCKTCRSTYAAANHLRRSYGLDKTAVLHMVAQQNGRCALCEERAAVHVDHDHVTGAVRGVLCPRCNLGLGHFGDRIDLVTRAITYLEATTWQKRRITPGVYRLTPPRPRPAAADTAALEDLIASRRG